MDSAPPQQKAEPNTPPVWIAQALGLKRFDAVAAQQHMAPRPRGILRDRTRPGTPREGAVLLPLFARQGHEHLLFIRRQDHLRYHPGQISFPGGRREGSETFLETALRETCEEVAIRPESLQVLGELTPVYIPPSDFIVHPFVAWHAGVPACTPDRREVAEIITVPLDGLAAERMRGVETRRGATGDVAVPYFLIGDHKAWGATAMMLSEFLERMQAVRP